MRACVSERVSASVPRNFIYGNPGAEKKSFSNTTPYGERGEGYSRGLQQDHHTWVYVNGEKEECQKLRPL